MVDPEFLVDLYLKIIFHHFSLEIQVTYHEFTLKGYNSMILNSQSYATITTSSRTLSSFQ